MFLAWRVEGQGMVWKEMWIDSSSVLLTPSRIQLGKKACRLEPDYI